MIKGTLDGSICPTLGWQMSGSYLEPLGMHITQRWKAGPWHLGQDVLPFSTPRRGAAVHCQEGRIYLQADHALGLLEGKYTPAGSR